MNIFKKSINEDLPTLDKNLKDIAIKSFPQLKDKSENYIHGFLQALNAAMNPIDSSAQDNNSSQGIPSQANSDLPKRIKGGSSNQTSGQNNNQGPLKPFKSDNQEDSQDELDNKENSKNNSTSSNQNKSNQSQNKKTPQIGDKQADDIKKLEDELRKAEIEKERLEDAQSGNLTNQEAEKIDDLTGRIAAIKQILSSEQVKAAVMQNTRDVKDAAAKRAQEKEIKKYTENPLVQFEIDLNNFIKKEIISDKDTSWARYNKNYHGTGVLKKGRYTADSGKLPLINVYFDQSGSWDTNDIKAGEAALATLNEFVRRGKIKVRVYYFGDTIETDVNSPRLHSGTSVGQDLLNHIKNNGADNVIILTDSDTDGTFKSPISIPGALYVLWRNQKPTSIYDYIKAGKHTATYNLTNV